MVNNNFSFQLKQFTDKTLAQVEAIHDGVTEKMRASVTEGSGRTGAPGQPADLRPKVQVEKPSPHVSVISLEDPSAQSVEDRISYRRGGHPLTHLHSPDGGFHSFALSAAAGQTVTDDVVKEVGG